MKKGLDRTILAAAVIGSLILVNLIGLRWFSRLDLTADGRFTLSDATAQALETIEDPVNVTAYFTEDLPPPFSTNARYVRDLLEEYHSTSDGVVEFEFIDPVGRETDEDKEKKKEVKRDIFGRAIRERTSVEQEMDNLGIRPVQVQVNEDDKVEVKRAYMGIAVSYGDQTEVIPVVQATEGLEYDLTTLIRKLTREKTPKLGILVGHEGPDLRENLSQAAGVMAQLYDIQPLDLTTEAEIPEDMDALLVIGPKTPLSEDEQKAIDAFIGSGRSVAFLLDAMKADFQALQAEESDHGLSDMIASYGVKIASGLVLDAQSATIQVAQQRGFMRVMQPVRYPFIPQPRSLDPDHPLTRGLSQVGFPFMSPLEIAEGGTAKAEVLIRSSEKSWVQTPPYDLNPMQSWSLDASKAGERVLAIALSGPIPSHFPDENTERADGRVLVVGGSSFIDDQFLAPGNQALVLNLMDWLVLDDALLAVRTRGLAAAPLEEIDEGRRSMIRYANVIGIPLAFVLFGLARWRMRERRRTQVAI